MLGQNFIKLYYDPITALVVGGTAAAAGTGIASAARGNRDKVQNQFLMNPEYPENTGARELWWKKLQDWEKQPGYGAIQPDWNNIWETVQNRVKQYYEGGPLTPGVKDRVRASLARRNMSENPASDFLLSRIDAEQGQTLSDIATQQGLAQANLSEEGRRTWLSSLEDLEARKPQGQWQTTIKPDRTNQILNTIGAIGSTAASAGIGLYGQQQQNAWLSSILKEQRTPQSFTPGPSGFNEAASMKKSPLLYWN